MGLPQEVIGRIIHMLQDNRRALKACSLTCKAMFASTRHLIHQTLHLTTGNNQKILTPSEKKQYAQADSCELELRLLSFMAERGLLKYARYLNIDIGSSFSSQTLTPHLRHFQSLDRIHTLTIRSPVLDTYNPISFAHLHHTLTTLELYSSTKCSGYVLHFITQFPNLQNLTLEATHAEAWGWSGTSPPLDPSRSPPLRGHLRCIGVSPSSPMWPRGFPSDLPHGIGFRSIEFRDVHCGQGQQILDGCADSLETFTIQIDRKGEHQGTVLLFPHVTEAETTPFLGHGELGHLRFHKNGSLKSVIIKTPFSNLPGLTLRSSCTNILGGASLSLSEFVLELSGLPSELTQQSLVLWGDWKDIDKRFESSLRFRPHFKVVIRTGRLYNRDEFQAQVRERFPLMSRRDRVQFETCLTR